ncbi:MAG: CoA transferase, partial [Anaerolineae bacterium]|nr:CoA transferase [Anaerolineae bacterium]
DMVAQAMSGAMSISGHADSPPTRTGYPISDVSGSLMAVTGILAALQARHNSGKGQHVDISMLDAQLSAMNYMAAVALMTGEDPARIGNSHTNHVPYNVYACQDGHIILAVVTDEFWQSLTECLEISGLDTPENKKRSGRLKNRAAIDQTLSDVFAPQPKAYWLEKIGAARVPCAPVNRLSEAFKDPQLIARNMVIDVEHADGETARMVGNPIKLSDSYDDTFTPAPRLGEHNREVFVNILDKSEIELERLAKLKVI